MNDRDFLAANIFEFYFHPNIIKFYDFHKKSVKISAFSRLHRMARNVKLEIRQIGGNFRAYHNFSYDQNTPEALKGAT
jgi:hypothetical protein